MKTTVELPDELMRAVKIRAVHEGQRIKDVMAYLIELGLSQVPRETGASPERVRLPLVKCAHEALPEKEMTPDRVAEVLDRDDVNSAWVAP